MDSRFRSTSSTSWSTTWWEELKLDHNYLYCVQVEIFRGINTISYERTNDYFRYKILFKRVLTQLENLGYKIIDKSIKDSGHHQFLNQNIFIYEV